MKTGTIEWALGPLRSVKSKSNQANCSLNLIFVGGDYFFIHKSKIPNFLHQNGKPTKGL